MKRRSPATVQHVRPIKPEQRPNKTTTAARALSDLAHELGPDAKLPTVAELREKLGVSVVTLNEALQEAESRQLIYRRHGVGIYVSHSIRKGVALACDPRFFRRATHSPFWDLLISHSEKRAAQKSEHFSFHFEASQPSSAGADRLDGSTTWEESSLRRAVAAREVQGVVSFGVEAETVSWIEGEGVPVVAYAGHARCTVNFDGPGGVAMGTRALLEEGCRDIELWQTHEEGNPPATPESDLSRAFRRSGAGSGIVREARVESGDTLQERGFALAQEVFGPEAFSSSAPRPDGIVLSNDLMAHGALTALRKLGVSPGHDVQIATHANAGSPILLGHDDILLIENDPAELAATMFNLLEGLMSGDLSRGQSVAISLAPHLRPVGEHAPHPRF